MWVNVCVSFGFQCCFQSSAARLKNRIWILNIKLDWPIMFNPKKASFRLCECRTSASGWQTCRPFSPATMSVMQILIWCRKCVQASLNLPFDAIGRKQQSVDEFVAVGRKSTHKPSLAKFGQNLDKRCKASSSTSQSHKKTTTLVVMNIYVD